LKQYLFRLDPFEVLVAFDSKWWPWFDYCYVPQMMDLEVLMLEAAA